MPVYRPIFVAVILPIFALTLPNLVMAQQELVYDDDTPFTSLSNVAAGDIELTRMTPEHPAKVLSIRMYMETAKCQAHIFIWRDNGGNSADLEQVLFETTVNVEKTGWLSVDIPEDTVILDPPQHFYVGHILEGDPFCQVSWDETGSDETRSLARMGEQWYSISDGTPESRSLDALIRATVSYFDVLEDRYFENTTDEAGLPTGMARMSWGDYDNDGDDDLLVSGRQLFRNNGDGTFDDVSKEAGIEGPTNGGVWADYDNDGHLDFYATVHNYLPACERDDDCLYCARSSGYGTSYVCEEEGTDHTCSEGYCMPPSGERPHDLLWHNNGDGTFTEVSEQAGHPYDYLPTEASAWGDFDGDGFVDIYVANYETPVSWTEGRLSQGNRDFLWRNNGDGTFTDVTNEAGLRPFITDYCGRGVSWADSDLDGDLDLYVANYRLHFNFHFQNLGDGTFEFDSFDNGTAGVNITGSYGHSIGATWADIDLDQDWDLFVANLAHPRFIEFSDKSMLYINSGSPNYVFEDHREVAGITFSETHSDPAFGDFDNDRFVDLFITDIYVGYQAFLYRNNGDLTFTDVTYPSGVDLDNGWGCAWADYDDDGLLDLVSRSLWRNQTPDAGHWLKVRLHGVESNRAAIGAIVRVTEGGQTQMRQVEGGKGTGVQNSLTLHFGLAEAETVEELYIRWPSGLEETYSDIAADQTVTYWEGGEEPGQDAGPDAGDGDADVAPSGGDDGCNCSVNSRRNLSGWLNLLSFF